MGKDRLFSEIPYLKNERITLRRLTVSDSDGLRELVNSPAVYRYLPVFLYEKKYPDIRYVISHLYDECIQESMILGVFEGDSFCGLAEMYGYRDTIRKISIGCRLLEKCWGRGIAAEVLNLMADYLRDRTDIGILAADTMVDNQASANVLRNSGFILAAPASSA